MEIEGLLSARTRIQMMSKKVTKICFLTRWNLNNSILPNLFDWWWCYFTRYGPIWEDDVTLRWWFCREQRMRKEPEEEETTLHKTLQNEFCTHVTPLLKDVRLRNDTLCLGYPVFKTVPCVKVLENSASTTIDCRVVYPTWFVFGCPRPLYVNKQKTTIKNFLTTNFKTEVPWICFPINWQLRATIISSTWQLIRREWPCESFY
jgi:hypothetical protein